MMNNNINTNATVNYTDTNAEHGHYAAITETVDSFVTCADVLEGFADGFIEAINREDAECLQ